MSEVGKVVSTPLELAAYAGKSSVRLSTIERLIVYAAVFLAPYPNLRFADVFFTVSDLLFCISLMILAIGGLVPRRPLDKGTPIWLLSFALLIAGLLTSSLLHKAPERGFLVAGQYLFSYLLLMVVLIREAPKEAERLAIVFIVSIVLIDIHGIYTFYFIGYVPEEGRGVVTGARRLATALRNPNLAAAMNALTVPMLLYLWISGRIRFYVALPMLVACGTTVILTSSNSGLIVFIVSILVFLSLTLTLRLLLRSAVVLCIVVALFNFAGTEFLPKTFHTRVLSAFTSGDVSEAGTFVSRAALMKEAVEVITHEQILLVGIGADQFRARSVQEAPVHNLYLLLWAEGGLLSVVGWLTFSAVGMLICLAIRKARGDKHALAAVGATSVVFLTIAMFNPHMYARYWTAPVFLAYGLGLTQVRLRPPVVPNLGHRR